MNERLSSPAEPRPRRGPGTPPPPARSYVPPPPTDAPLWLHPLVLVGTLVAVLGVALLLWTLPGAPPSEELTAEELAVLMAEPPPPSDLPPHDLPPRWDTPSRPSDLRLTTDPAGASVQLNREWVGTTPVRLGEMPPGFYELRIASPDHAPKDTSFYLASGSFLHLDIRLDPAQAEDAAASSDVTAAPRTPRQSGSANLPARRQLQRQGRPSGGGAAPAVPAPAVPEFSVASPEAVRQASHTGSLSVTSNPPGAIVLVDGVPFGRTPLSLSDLRPATYVVTFTLPGYVPITYQAEVTAQSVSVVKGVFPPPSGE